MYLNSPQLMKSMLPQLLEEGGKTLHSPEGDRTLHYPEGGNHLHGTFILKTKSNAIIIR